MAKKAPSAKLKAPLTLEQVFETLPKSERTLVKRGFRHVQWFLINDLGYPCVYRVVGMDKSKCLGAVKYYKGRLLSMYGIK